MNDYVRAFTVFLMFAYLPLTIFLFVLLGWFAIPALIAVLFLEDIIEKKLAAL